MMSNHRRILHAADIHLDSPLQKLDRYDGAPAERIRKASRHALERLVDLGIEQGVDLVVIAGDLYDGDWPDQNTGLAFVKQATRLINAEIPLLVIRGNHDAANQMTRSLPLPKNPDGSEIFLSARDPETRLFENVGLVVHGQSFRTRAETKNLAAHYPEPRRDLFNLGLLHTGLEGQTSHAHYAPCSPVQLTDKGYDYWALGHIHTRNNHAIEGGPPIVFSGNIQGRHIGELGAKGCVLIEIDSRQQCRFDFHPVDVLRFVLCELDVSELKHVDEVLDAFQLWLTESIERADGRLLVVRVRLSGITSIHQSLHRQADSLRADLQAITISTAGEQAWFEEVRLSTSAGLIDARADGSTDDDFFADDASPLASIEHVLHQWQSGVLSHELIEKELSGLAKKLPRELKSSETTTTLSFNDPVWIRELVESSAAEVLGRLQGDDQ